jgi:hypothetical protein
MPTLTVSRQCENEKPVVQSLYDWFFSEEGPIQRTAWECYGEVIVAAESQLEMFPQSVVSDYFFFRVLVEKWRVERGSTSSTTEMVLCPAYQSIIGMGPNAVPLILAELASEGDDPDHWFWALQVLTGANPVSEEDEGNLRRMSRAWLEWAASQGYAW